MNTLILTTLGIIAVIWYARRLPRDADRVSEKWLKENIRAEGADLEVEPRPALRLVQTEGASAPKAYSRPVSS